MSTLHLQFVLNGHSLENRYAPMTYDPATGDYQEQPITPPFLAIAAAWYDRRYVREAINNAGVGKDVRATVPISYTSPALTIGKPTLPSHWVDQYGSYDYYFATSESNTHDLYVDEPVTDYGIPRSTTFNRLGFVVLESYSSKYVYYKNVNGIRTQFETPRTVQAWGSWFEDPQNPGDTSALKSSEPGNPALSSADQRSWNYGVGGFARSDNHYVNDVTMSYDDYYTDAANPPIATSPVSCRALCGTFSRSGVLISRQETFLTYYSPPRHRGWRETYRIQFDANELPVGVLQVECRNNLLTYLYEAYLLPVVAFTATLDNTAATLNGTATYALGLPPDDPRLIYTWVMPTATGSTVVTGGRAQAYDLEAIAAAIQSGSATFGSAAGYGTSWSKSSAGVTFTFYLDVERTDYPALLNQANTRTAARTSASLFYPFAAQSRLISFVADASGFLVRSRVSGTAPNLLLTERHNGKAWTQVHSSATLQAPTLATNKSEARIYRMVQDQSAKTWTVEASDDIGETWQQMAAPYPNTYKSAVIAWHGHGIGAACALTSGGLPEFKRSMDGGKTWLTLGTTAPSATVAKSLDIRFDDVNDRVIVVSDAWARVSRDFGATWADL